MSLQIKALGDGQLGTDPDAEPLYTTPEGKKTIVKGIRLVNTDSSPIKVNLYYRKEDGEGDNRHIIPVDLSLPAGGSFVDDAELTLEAGNSLRGDAETIELVDYVISGVERDEA